MGPREDEPLDPVRFILYASIRMLAALSGFPFAISPYKPHQLVQRVLILCFGYPCGRSCMHANFMSVQSKRPRIEVLPCL